MQQLIPFVSQLGWGYSNLCGSANIAMWLRGYRKEAASPVTIAKRLGVLGQFTTLGQIVAGLLLYGIEAKVSYAATWKFIKGKIDKNIPVIALVDYREFKSFPRKYKWAHFVTVLGYDDQYVYIHDPLQYSGPTAVPITEFKAAIASPSLYNDSGTPTDERDDLENSPFLAVYALNPLEINLKPVSGVNIDPRNPIGNPNVSQLAGFGWARFAYRVSMGTGNTDLTEPHDKYGPVIDNLVAAGITPIIVLNHETYGEAKGYDWNKMTPELWKKLSDEFLQLAGSVAARYRNRGIVWQIWNEGDQASEAAVAIPPEVYGPLFKRFRDHIQAVDPSAKVITQGYVSGTVTGPAYHTKTGIGANTDGIAFHPYLAKAAGYGSSPTFAQQISAWSVFGADLFITEYGQPSNYNATDQQLADYASAALLASSHTKVEAACWFAWADGMHTSVGVMKGNTRRDKLFDALTKTQVVYDPPKPSGYAVGTYKVKMNQLFINARAEADTAAAILGQVKNDDILTVDNVEVSNFNDNYFWQKFKWNGKTVWLALMPSYTLTPTTPPPANTLAPIIEALYEEADKSYTQAERLLELAARLENL